MSDEEGLNIFIQSLAVTFEYHRSVEYRFKRRTAPPQCTSKRSKSSKEPPPGGGLPEGGAENQPLGSSNPGTPVTLAEVDSDHGQEWDLIDLINSTSDAEGAETAGSHGADGSRGVCGGAGCGGASESVFHPPDAAQKAKPVLNLCPACYQRYRTVRRCRAPIKDKLLDKDPSSLTCDQWLLIKTRRRGKPTPCSLRRGRGDARLLPPGRERRAAAAEHVACSRPHVFLQRNLRRCSRLWSKRRTQRKGASPAVVGP